MTIDAGETPVRRGTPATHDADGSLRVTSDAGVVVVLNPTAAALWELLDGETSVDELVSAATSLFSGSPEKIRRDISLALGDLAERGLAST